jgi:hypothetical protein
MIVEDSEEGRSKWMLKEDMLNWVRLQRGLTKDS